MQFDSYIYRDDTYFKCMIKNCIYENKFHFDNGQQSHFDLTMEIQDRSKELNEFLISSFQIPVNFSKQSNRINLLIELYNYINVIPVKYIMNGTDTILTCLVSQTERISAIEMAKIKAACIS